MTAELKLWMSLTRNLPRVRGAGALANYLIRVYNRKSRAHELADVGGCVMELDPSECVDSGLLFYPQLYDHREIRVLRDTLGEGDCFLDVGAYIGFYSLLASAMVGPRGRVVAIEAEPRNYERLVRHIEMNGLTNVEAMHRGVADRRETLRLGLNLTGNRSGSSFLSDSQVGIELECAPLLDVVREAGIGEIAAMKLDIEGLEYRALAHFWTHAPRSLWPRLLILEFFENRVEQEGGNSLELARSHGYVLLARTRYNVVLILA
jgi:FkbM family methyltransferase